MTGSIAHRLFVSAALLLVICLGGCAHDKDTATAPFPYRFELAYRYGMPVADPELAWPHHIAYASWLDDTRIVFAAGPDDFKSPMRIACLSLEQNRIAWSLDDHGPLSDWSCSAGAGRLAIISSDAGEPELDHTTRVAIIDGDTGRKSLDLSKEDLAPMLGAVYPLPEGIALSDSGRLLLAASIATEEQVQSRTIFSNLSYKAFVLDPPYRQVKAAVDMDRVIIFRGITVSPDGARMGYFNRDQLLCVRDCLTGKVVFRRGKLPTALEEQVIVFDGDDYTDLFDGGGDWIVYTVDHGWSTTQVLVHNLRAGQTRDFDSDNAHAECDVHFADRRIVITGTSTDLTLTDFSGNVLAHANAVSLQRNLCVAFSPSGKQVLVGSCDDTLSVYNIVPVSGPVQATAPRVTSDNLFEDQTRRSEPGAVYPTLERAAVAAWWQIEPDSDTRVYPADDVVDVAATEALLKTRAERIHADLNGDGIDELLIANGDYINAQGQPASIDAAQNRSWAVLQKTGDGWRVIGAGFGTPCPPKVLDDATRGWKDIQSGYHISASRGSNYLYQFDGTRYRLVMEISDYVDPPADDD